MSGAAGPAAAGAAGATALTEPVVADAPNLASVPMLMLGDLFVASTSSLDPSNLTSGDAVQLFLDGCRLGAPGSSTLFINRKAAEAAGARVKLPQFVQEAAEAVKGSGPKDVAPWRIQRVPIKAGFKLLQAMPAQCRLAVPAEDLAISITATKPPQRKLLPGQKLTKEQQEEDERAAAAAPKGRIPLFRLPGLALAVRPAEPGAPLLLLSPAFLSPRALQTAVELGVAGQQEMQKRLRKMKRAWIQDGVQRLEQEIRSVQGWVEHQVGEAESIGRVAERYRTTPEAVMKDNGLPEGATEKSLLPKGAVLQVLADPDGDWRGAGVAVKAGLLGLRKSALLKLEDIYASFDFVGAKDAKMPARFAMKAGFLEDMVQQLATVNASAAVARTPDGKVPDTRHIQEGLAAGLSTYLATAFLFGGQELVSKGSAQLVVPPPPPTPIAAPSNAKEEATTSKPTSGKRGRPDPAAAAEAAEQPAELQQQQQRQAQPRPLLLLDPKLTPAEAAGQLGGAIQVGSVVASHMAAVAAMEETAQIAQQKRVIGAMLKQQLGLEGEPHFELQPGLAIQFDQQVVEGRRPDTFLAPVAKATGADAPPPVVRGLLLVGDVGLEELQGPMGIPLPQVEAGEGLAQVAGVTVAVTKLAAAANAAAGPALRRATGGDAQAAGKSKVTGASPAKLG